MFSFASTSVLISDGNNGVIYISALLRSLARSLLFFRGYWAQDNCNNDDDWLRDKPIRGRVGRVFTHSKAGRVGHNDPSQRETGMTSQNNPRPSSTPCQVIQTWKKITATFHDNI